MSEISFLIRSKFKMFYPNCKVYGFNDSLYQQKIKSKYTPVFMIIVYETVVDTTMTLMLEQSETFLY